MVPASVVVKRVASLSGFLGICLSAVPAGITKLGFAGQSATTAEPETNETFARVPLESGVDTDGNNTSAAQRRRRRQQNICRTTEAVLRF